jgi:multidrug efflux system membrane fusion protein
MTRNKWLAAIALVAGLAGVLWLRARRADETNADAVVPVSVTVAEVQHRDLPLTITAAGRAEAKASVSVKPRVDGQVADVTYTEGQPVHTGQLLLRLDPAVLQAQQRQAEGVLARDEALLVKAKNDYQRYVALASRDYVSKSGLNQSQADLGAAQANVQADRASLDNARLQLSYTQITAPMDGVAGALLLPVGGAATANNTTLLVINQIKPIYVTFSIPESQLARLKLAMSKGAVAVSATVTGIDMPMHGKLAFIDNAVDVASGTITAKAVFDNADGLLTPGQFAQVTVQLDELPNALVVPDQAVESGVDGPYVFVVNADATAAIRPLTVGAQSSGFSVVTSGLAAGERVVMTGQAQLRDKAKVTITAVPADTSQQP